MPKKKFQVEFVFKASPNILYGFLVSPTGMAQWFADSVDTDGNIYIFNWSGTEDRAVLVESHEPDYARFRWEWAGEDEYFEFRITKSEVASDTVLYITDFAEPNEVEDQKRLWENQIGELMARVGG